MKTFAVRYGTLVKGMTTFAVVLLLAAVAVGLFHFHGETVPGRLLVVLPLVLLIGTALFTVRRYEIDAAGLHVVRPVGRLLIAAAVSTVAADDGALKGAMRTFGNGGLFSFNGWYSLPKYGSCRLWVTDLQHLVVLRGDRGCAVVSPAHREVFVAAVKARFGVTS